MKNVLLSFAVLFINSIIAQIPTGLNTTLNSTADNYFFGKSTKGLSAAVYHSNSGEFGFYTRGYSHEEAGSQVPIDEYMFFSIGSNSKLLSSVALLKLQEQSLLDLDDAIDLYIPNVSPHIDGNITIRQLLQHRSGLHDYINTDALDSMNTNYNRLWTPQEIVDKFVLAPLNTPGIAFNYCNTNYLLAGMIIESVTSQTFGDAVNNLIFTPGQVDSLYLMGFETVEGRLAHAWDHQVLTPINGDITNIPTTSPGCFSWAAGGYYAKPKGLVEIYKSIFIDRTVINNASIAELDSFTLTGAAQPYNKYGLGIFVVTLPALDARFHTGSWWQQSSVGIDVENNNIAVACINETEGLNTSIDYSNLMIQMLLDMREADESASISELNNMIKITHNNKNLFTFSKSANPKVFDLKGAEVATKHNTQSIDLSHLPKGVYIIKLGDYSEKIIIK